MAGESAGLRALTSADEVSHGSVGRVALFSIHPGFANAILDGTKQVEFRRQGLPADVTHVVIYATSPVCRIVGMFEIGGIVKTSPTQAWRRYGKVGGIDHPPFKRYYEGAGHAFVIQVRRPERFDVPVALTDLQEHLRPPQSYMYLADALLHRLQFLSSPHEPSALAKFQRALRRAAKTSLSSSGLRRPSRRAQGITASP